MKLSDAPSGSLGTSETIVSKCLDTQVDFSMCDVTD